MRTIFECWLRASLPGLLVTALLSAPAIHAESAHSINLRSVGYPSPPCDFPSLESDLFGTRSLEFLDSGHLLAKFPVRKGDVCRSAGFPWPIDFRSVVMDISGKIVSSENWSRPQVTDVTAGPDGKILELVPSGIRLLDDSFHPTQRISLPGKDFPASRPPSPWSIQLSPSRHGFAAVYPEFIGRGFSGFSIYFAGPQLVHEVVSLNTDWAIVGDGVMVPANGQRGFVAETRSVKIDDVSYTCASGYWIAIPQPDRPICLTSEYHLVALTAGRGQRLIADVHNLAPGLWRSGFRYLATDKDAHRILLDSFGVRFPVTDSWGFGSYRKVAVYDLSSGQQVFRIDLPFNSYVAISPDGRHLAVQRKSKIRIYDLR